MPSEVVRPYRGVSAEQRRSQRRARLIEAALDELGAEGVTGLTMTAVCARAGLTERYFYESFGNRDELLGAVFDACVAEMNEALFSALLGAPADLLQRCRAGAAVIVGRLTGDPRQARMLAEAAGSSVLAERQTRVASDLAELLAAQMRELRGLDRPEHAAPLRLGTLVLFGGLSHAIIGWLDGTLPMSRETLIEECARLAVAVGDAVQATTA